MPKQIGAMQMQRIYELYLQKVTRKGHTQAELDEVLSWLTGLPLSTWAELPAAETITEFCERAQWNPAADAITGVVCGVRVETITDPLMRRVREMDKVVDELAKGKAIAKVTRQAVR